MDHATQDEQRQQEKQEVANRETELFNAEIADDLSIVEAMLNEMRKTADKYKNIDTDAIIKERVMELLE